MAPLLCICTTIIPRFSQRERERERESEREINYAEARERKRNKYLSLKAEIQGRGYCALIVPIQVGSRGMLDVEGFDSLKPYLNITVKLWRLSTLLKQQEQSHKIWVERNWQSALNN